MMRKKLFLLTALACTVLTTTAFIGCKKDDEEGVDVPNKPEITYTVNLKADSILLTIGDKSVLDTDLVQQGDTKLTFTSSNEEVATVDQYGWVTAIKEGTTTITASYGTATDTCEVTVTLNGMSPMLKLPGVPTDSVSMSKLSNLDLNGEVVFNDKTYDDVSLTYEMSDTSVGTIENGVFKPAKGGTTTITVKGTWRGVEGPAMIKTVTVEIIPEFLFVINEGVSEITLYSLDEGTQDSFFVEAEYDGEALETSVEVTQGEDYIDYDPNAHTVTSKGLVGEAELTVSYELNGEAMQIKVPVYVKPTMYDYATTVTNFSAIHGDVTVGDNLLALVGEPILSAYDQEGNAFEVKEDKIYGVPSSKDGKFTTKLTVYTATRGWNMDIEGYSGVIGKAEDLRIFKTNVSYASVDGKRAYRPIDETKPMQKWEGYYILANNINASGYDHGKNAQGEAGKENGVGIELASRGLQSSADYGFFGTFDGQGYTISNMRVRSFGLFGYIVNATIKNVAFTGVDLYHSSTYKQTSVLAAWIKNSTLTDVYISVRNTDEKASEGSVLANGIDASTVTRCIVETKEAFKYKDGLTMTGSFTYQNKERMDDDKVQTSFSDVYVISNVVLGSYKSSKTEVGADGVADTEDDVKVPFRYYIQAENETLTVGEDDVLITFTGVKKYSTRTDMQAAGNSYTSFNNAYWTTTSGTPVWKNL